MTTVSIRHWLSGIALAVACALAVTPDALAQQKKQIKLSHPFNQTEPSETATSAWVFRNYINENSDTLEVKIFPANALGEERAVFEGMQLGSGASCAIGGTAILSNFSKRIGVIDLPFLWTNYDHMHRGLDGEVGAAIAKDLEGSGFKVLAYMDSWGYRQVVTTKKEVTTPDQIKGLKIRTIQSPVFLAAINVMGANATPMAYGEIYTALQTGVLDGFEHSASTVLSQKFHEVTKHMALTRHMLAPFVMTCSMKEWNGLTEKEKSVVTSAAALARDIERGLAPIKESEAMTGLKAKGMAIHTLDTTAFRSAAIPIQDKLAQERGAADLLKIIRAAQ